MNEPSVQGPRGLSELLPTGSLPLGLQALSFFAPGDTGAFPGLPLPAPFPQALTETSQGKATVPVLTAVIPGRSGDAGGEMGQSDTTLGGILVLAPWPTGSKGVDPALAEEGVVVAGDGEIVGHGVESDPGGPGAFQWTSGTSTDKDGVGRGRT